MSTEKNGYVKWTVFAFIVMLLITAFGWFANFSQNNIEKVNAKLEKIDDAVGEIRTDIAVIKKHVGVNGNDTSLVPAYINQRK